MKFKTETGYLTFQILSLIISLVSYILALQSEDLIISIFIYFVPLPLEILEIISFNSVDNGYNYKGTKKKIEWIFFNLNLLLLIISLIIVVILIFGQFEIIVFNDSIYRSLAVIYPFENLVELLVTMAWSYKKRKKAICIIYRELIIL